VVEKEKLMRKEIMENLYCIYHSSRVVLSDRLTGKVCGEVFIRRVAHAI
jgi:hypothetical protein